MLSEYDYGAIACWAMHLAERISNAKTINFDNYKKVQVVRFNNNREEWRKNISMFQCQI